MSQNNNINIAPLTITLILTSMILIQSAFSTTQTIDNPANIGELKVKITQHGKIIVSDGNLEWIKINLTFPKDNSNQLVTTTEKYIEDEHGNNILTIMKDNPPNTITYSAESIVTIKERNTLHIPEIYTIPDDIKIYLKPTENIQSDNKDINNLAKELTKDSKTDFERISNLATWVHDNVEYKINLGAVAKDALWTMENKIGTCDEFASLFIALARASGYPARYISGHAYGKDGWEKHAFAEVYIGRWIPVDPTWNEVGNLDATHIQFTTKEDNIVKNEVQVYGREIGNILWTEDETDIDILKVTEKEREKDYELTRSSDRLEMNEEALIVLKFTPKEYKVIKLDLEPCISTEPIVEIEDKEKSIILEPGKEKIVYWKIKISDNLKKNMEYTCPLTLNSRLLSIRTINLTINTLVNQKSDDISIYAKIDKKDLIMGEKQTLEIDIKKIQGKNPTTIGIISNNEHIIKTITLNPSETATITHKFTPKQSGEHSIIIYSSTGQTKTISYTVSENGDIYIDTINIPKYAKINEEISITINIKSSRNAEDIMKFTTTLEDKEDIISTKIDKEKEITTIISSSTTGNKKVSFRLTAPTIESKTTRNIRFYTKPEIYIDTAYDYDKNTARLNITSEKDIPGEITIDINNITKKITEPQKISYLDFNLPPGTHTAIIKYTDLGDNKYIKNTTITIKERSMIEKIISYINKLIKKIIG